MKALFALILLVSQTTFATEFVNLGQFDTNLRYHHPEIKIKIRSGIEKIVDHFDQDCGDVWCEGEYWNLTNMYFDCSVDYDLLGQAPLSNCRWAIAGANFYVDDRGQASGDSQVYICKFSPENITIAQFFKQIDETRNPLDAVKLDENGKTLRQVLNNCL